MTGATRLPLAVTGGAAMGKSTVTAILAEKGWRVWNADQVVRDLWADPNWRKRIAALVESDDSNVLRRRVYTEPQIRRALNSMLHGVVTDDMMRTRADVYEVPLLIETCLHPQFERVWAVQCAPETQRLRLLARLQDPAEVDGVIASQLPARVRGVFADEIIRTDGPLEDVTQLIWSLANRIGA